MSALVSDLYLHASASACRRSPLRDERRNVYSQFGEDGIVDAILERIGRYEHEADGPLWCVEFGAWDGIHLSNTRRLIEEHDANAVLIEADRKRYGELVKNCRGHEGVTAICQRIEWKGERSLYRILLETDLPERFDVLSIDIDGHDWFIWSSLRSYRARVVVCEFNPTMPYGVAIVPPYDAKRRPGCSLGALVELGREKGYTLVAVTEVNAIFVEDEYVARLGLGPEDLSIGALTEGLPDFRTWLIHTPDGHVMVHGNQQMMWHETPIDVDRIQPLPRVLRKHTEAMGWFGKLWLRYVNARRRRRAERQSERGAA